MNFTEIRYRGIFFSLIRDSTYFLSAKLSEKKKERHIHTRYSFLNIANNNWIFFDRVYVAFISSKTSLACVCEGKKVFEHTRKLGTESCGCFFRHVYFCIDWCQQVEFPADSVMAVDGACVCATDAYICIYAHTIPRAVGGMQISQRET